MVAVVVAFEAFGFGGPPPRRARHGDGQRGPNAPDSHRMHAIRGTTPPAMAPTQPAPHPLPPSEDSAATSPSIAGCMLEEVGGGGEGGGGVSGGGADGGVGSEGGHRGANGGELGGNCSSDADDVTFACDTFDSGGVRGGVSGGVSGGGGDGDGGGGDG